MHLDFESSPGRQGQWLVERSNSNRRLVSSSLASIGGPKRLGLVIEQIRNWTVGDFAIFVLRFRGREVGGYVRNLELFPFLAYRASELSIRSNEFAKSHSSFDQGPRIGRSP